LQNQLYLQAWTYNPSVTTYKTRFPNLP
jgi:hypothetical protein